MKKLFRLYALGLAGMVLLNGCVGLQVGGGSKTSQNPTVGQQLLDLQRAREAGVITEAEFQNQKGLLLQKPH